MRRFPWLVVAVAIIAVSSVTIALYMATNPGATVEPAPTATAPAVDPTNLALKLSSLYYSALEDNEMRSHLPVKMQLAMGITARDRFLYDVISLEGISAQRHVYGWDHESYLRSKNLDVSNYCLRAHEVFTGGIEWVPRGAFWDEFKALCTGVHSHDALVGFAKLPEAITDECKSKISEGWVVNRNEIFYDPSSNEAPGDLGAGGDRSMAFARCIPPNEDGPYNNLPTGIWGFFGRSGHGQTSAWHPTHPLPLDDTGEVALGEAYWEMSADLASIREAALEDDELRSRLPKDVQTAMGTEPFAYQTFDCTGVSCRMIEGLEHGWDHESYLRSRGLDTYDYCLTAHSEFVEEIGWLAKDAYWDRFMYVCEHIHSHDALESFSRLPDTISDECASYVSEGWVVGKSGLFYSTRSLDTLYSRPYDYHRLAHDANGDVVNFAKDCVVSGSGEMLDFFQPRPYTYEWTHKDIEASPLAEGDPGITKRDLAAELASLYAMAAEDDGLRSLLPADIQEILPASNAA